MRVEEFFTLFEIKECLNEVCVPSTDYYRRGNDWQTETINSFYLKEIKSSSKKDELIEYLPSLDKGEYIILSKYVVKN